MRYTANGTLDSSFGSGGKVFESGWSAMYSVAVQTDGKVLVGLDEQIARLNANGTPDTGFGTDGLATANGTVTVLVERSDGEIVAGTDFLGIEYNVSVTLFHSTGEVDTSFGTDPITSKGWGAAGSTSVDVFDWHAGVTSAVIATGTGDILLAGYAIDLGIFVFCVDSDGVPVSGFGSDGLANFGGLTPPGDGEFTNSGPLMAVQSDGKILINYETSGGATGGCRV